MCRIALNNSFANPPGHTGMKLIKKPLTTLNSNGNINNPKNNSLILWVKINRTMVANNFKKLIKSTLFLHQTDSLR